MKRSRSDTGTVLMGPALRALLGSRYYCQCSSAGIFHFGAVLPLETEGLLEWSGTISCWHCRCFISCSKPATCSSGGIFS